MGYTECPSNLFVVVVPFSMGRSVSNFIKIGFCYNYASTSDPCIIVPTLPSYQLQIIFYNEILFPASGATLLVGIILGKITL